MINAWRTGVFDYLTTQFDAADVVAGERDGVWRGDNDLIAVWWPGWDERSRDISLAQPTLTLRYFPAISKQPQPETPVDPSPLEEAADALLAAFPRDKQGANVFATNVACRITSIRPNYDPAIWRLDATMVAYTLGATA
jgi:hypothetical protein